MAKEISTLEIPRRYLIQDHSFIEDTYRKRLPKILRSIKTEDPDFRKWVDQTADEFENSSFFIKEINGSDGGPSWNVFSAGLIGKNSEEVDWFYAENYIYREMLLACKYFERKVDPFQQQKDDALKHGLDTMIPLNEIITANDDTFSQVLEALILQMLWGNRADLSLSGGAIESHTAHENASDFLPVDDLAKVVNAMGQMKNPRIGVVLDNCGTELLADLNMAAYILGQFQDSKVTFFCKKQPVFVSDALVVDVKEHAVALIERFGKQYDILQSSLETGRFELRDHEFFTSPLDFADKPADLTEKFNACDIIFVKGDANYRRLLGDRVWASDSSFAKIVSYFGKPKVVALRTCKSPIVVGIDQEKVKKLESVDSEWNTNGKYGVISFKE